MTSAMQWDPPEVLAARGRRLIAERLRWPGGAVEACERIERERPGFEVWWFAKNVSRLPWFNRAEGFYAWRTGDQPGLMCGSTWRGRMEWYGATAEELGAQLSMLV